MKPRLMWADVVVRALPPHVLASALLLACVASCRERKFEFDISANQDAAVDMAAQEGGGSSDVGEGAHDSGGPEGVCVPKTEICNGKDDDCNGMIDDVAPATVASDLANCGACGAICSPPNSVPACEAGVCKIKECLPGAFDADGMLKTGCECLKSNGGVEICDGMDNDCNGKTDEGFDLSSDIANCGVCGKRCIFPFAVSKCGPVATDGGVSPPTCTIDHCLPGFYDRDGDPGNGCETACLKSNGGVEICDGQDNDCNGMVDDMVTPPSITCKTAGVCAGATVKCGGIMGWVCDYGASYESVEGMGKGCDGLDNDCDGKTDEGFDIGKSCPVGMGTCVTTGLWVCDATKPEKRRCEGTPKTPSAEICNGLDDDCDGKIDEIETAADVAAVGSSRVTYFAGKDVTIFRYEASRPDASGTSPGFDAKACRIEKTAAGGPKQCSNNLDCTMAGDACEPTTSPCSLSGKLPWANVTKEEAAAACGKLGAGWRLCTKDEWFDGCNGSANTTFPYGATYNGTKCNDYDYSAGASVKAIPTGTAAMCMSDLAAGSGEELYDMSGNVKEWTLTTVSPAAYELRGGAYNIASFGAPPSAPGLQCDASTPAPTVDVRLPSVGFRCCRPGMLP